MEVTVSQPKEEVREAEDTNRDCKESQKLIIAKMNTCMTRT